MEELLKQVLESQQVMNKQIMEVQTNQLVMNKQFMEFQTNQIEMMKQIGILNKRINKLETNMLNLQNRLNTFKIETENHFISLANELRENLTDIGIIFQDYNTRISKIN